MEEINANQEKSNLAEVVEEVAAEQAAEGG